MLLGIVGVFAIPGIVLVAKKYRSQPIIIFVVLFLLVIVVGRVITYVNADFVFSDYCERRMIPLVYVSASLLAPIAVLRLINRIKEEQQQQKQQQEGEEKKRWIAIKHLKYLKNTLIVIILSFLVLGGILSTFLSTEYQILDISKYTLTNNEINLQSALNNVNPYSTLLTVTGRSMNVAEYYVLGSIVNYYRYQLWPSESPELPLHCPICTQ